MPDQEKPEAVRRIESIIARRQQGTEQLQKSWKSGELTRRDLPCHAACTGQITVGSMHGKCPMYMRPDVCPLVEEKERNLQASMSEAGFGPRYHHPDTSRLRALEPIDEYMKALPGNINRGRGIVFFGDVGVGKTTTLAYMARRILAGGWTVWCVHTPQLIEMLRTDDRQAALTKAMNVDVFMLDDLGSGEMDGDILGAMESIAEHRYARHMLSMVSTNMTPEELVANIPLRRMVDRWRQTNMIVKIGGTTMRNKS